MNKKIKKLSFSIIFGIIFISVVFTFYYTFSLEDGYEFENLVYDVQDNYIMGISSKTEVDLFYKYFDLDNCSIKVVDENEKEIKKGYVYTGSETLLYDHSNNLISRYTNIIYGDITEDGIVDNKDLEIFGRSLVYDSKMSDYQIKAMDMDLDGEAKINDLVSMDKILNSSYKSLTLNYEEYTMLSGEELRLVGAINPDKILNLNLKWSSSDEKIASVSEAGLVTAKKEGEVVISATTMDNKVSAKMKLIVDDTVRLESNEGVGYYNGEKVRVGIRSVDYKNLSCVSSKSNIASCEIVGEELIVNPLFIGSTVITVDNGEYGSVSYNFSVVKTNISIFPNYQCISVNSGRESTFSSFNAGEIEFDVSDSEIIKDAYIYSNRFVVKTGSKPGRGYVTIKESNGSSVKVFTADVYDVRMAKMGEFVDVGAEVGVKIEGGNLQDLSCVSPDETKVTCRVDKENMLLYVGGVEVGTYNLYVKNKITYGDKTYDCGEALLVVVVRSGESET